MKSTINDGASKKIITIPRELIYRQDFIEYGVSEYLEGRIFEYSQVKSNTPQENRRQLMDSNPELFVYTWYGKVIGMTEEGNICVQISTKPNFEGEFSEKEYSVEAFKSFIRYRRTAAQNIVIGKEMHDSVERLMQMGIIGQLNS